MKTTINEQLTRYQAMCHNGFKIREHDFIESNGRIQVLDCYIPYKTDSNKALLIELTYSPFYISTEKVQVVINLYEVDKSGGSNRTTPINYFIDVLNVKRKTIVALCRYTAKYTKSFIEELLYDYARIYLQYI